MQTALVTGANRGIGLELVKELLKREFHVIAACRKPESADALNELSGGQAADKPSPAEAGETRPEVIALDVGDAESVKALATDLRGRTIDVLLNNAGIMQRETGIADIDYDHWLQTLAINTLAPVRLAGALRPNLLGANCPRVVTVSSQMGSITRASAGSVSYRSSKAAVNMAMRSLADEWREDGIVVCTVHPGWVRTDMGGSDADLAPTRSAADLVGLIDGLTMANTGSFLNHDGSVIPW
jgi:NAD(P)-dependent dehydrogenase (short-subunit alcohol dehydrogenase family)